MTKILSKQKIVAGIDIGGTNTSLGILDDRNEIIFERTFETRPDEGPSSFVERLAGIIRTGYSGIEEKYELTGIGIAAPSANYLNGTIESPVNLNWGNVRLIEMMKEHFDIPVALINDANAAALGEHKFGAGRGMKNFIMLTLGTGLGSGIFVNGKILHGENGLAGELGHTIVIPNGRKCSCGRSGCLETYVSASGIKRSAFYFMSHVNEKSELRNINFRELTSKKVSELADKGDAVALRVFDYTGEILGKAMANAVTLFNPEAIILFGGLADADKLLFDPAKFYFEKYLLNIYKGKAKILKSELQNGRAAVLGACCFIIDTINNNMIYV